MYYFVEIACIAAEILIIQLFLSSFFQSRQKNIWIFRMAYLGFGAVIAVLSFIEDASLLRILTSFVGISGLALLLFETKLSSAMFSSFIFCAILAITDVLVNTILVLCGIDGKIMMEQSTARLLYIVTEHILLFGIIILIGFINRNRYHAVSAQMLLMLLPCWTASILLGCLLYTQIYEGQETLPMPYVLVLLGLLYTNFAMIYFSNKTHRQELSLREAAISAHHYAMQAQYYDQFKLQQEETRALWHDFSKYIRAIQAEHASGITDSATMEKLQEKVNSITSVVDVNNPIVNVILNEYIQAARQSDIKLALDVRIPEELFIPTADLYILIGNTLDNALEACSELPVEQRTIHLQFLMQHDILFYKVENPYLESHLQRVRGKYHGYGLKNVQHCVEKYQGSLEIQKQKGIFCVSAYLNKPENRS